ncbi:MAG: hypothetical protein PVJ02_08560 [Gemmatimonadota bacterium]|jgi:hypothetical protein
MKERTTRWTGVAVLAAALLALLPKGIGSASIGSLYGAGILSDLACVTCGAAGVAAILSGGVTLATFLWAQASFVGTTTCLAVCTAALTT